MSDTSVTLGSVTFQGFEVPDRIPFGGEQMLAIHKQIGGKRIIDSLGRDDLALEWSGRFTGPDALDRARALDAIRVAGKQVALTWSELSFKVVVRRFVADFEKVFHLPYQIVCEVVEDTATPKAAGDDQDIDDQMDADASDAVNAGEEIGDPTLSGMLADVRSAVSAVPTFVTATASQLNSVLAPIGLAQGQLGSLIGSAEAVLGGVANTAADLINQGAAALQLPTLYRTGSILSRLTSNLTSAGSAGAQLVTAGGDLGVLAAQIYGSASGWTTLARANNLLDPVLQGIHTLRIPPVIDAAGGVLEL